MYSLAVTCCIISCLFRTFTIHIYALDGQDLVLDPDILAAELRNLTQADKDRIDQAGFNLDYEVKTLILLECDIAET